MIMLTTIIFINKNTIDYLSLAIRLFNLIEIQKWIINKVVKMVKADKIIKVAKK